MQAFEPLSLLLRLVDSLRTICERNWAPQTPEHLKTPTAEEAFNPDGLVQRSIRLLKDSFPDLEVSLLPACHVNAPTAGSCWCSGIPGCCKTPPWSWL